MKFTATIALFFIYCVNLMSQSLHDQYRQLHKKINSDYFESYKVPADRFFEQMKHELALSEGIEMSLVRKSEVGQMTHYRYQQYYRDIPIEGNQLLLHQKDGHVVRTNGVFTPKIDVSTTPTLAGDEIIDRARLIFTMLIDNNGVNVIDIESTQLVLIDDVYPQHSGYLNLAYKVLLSSNDPYERMSVYLDAHTGDLLYNSSMIQGISAVGKGETRYYGDQDITSDSIAPNLFILHDSIRNITISSKGKGTMTSKTSDWHLSANTVEDVALDAMYCSSKMYDYWLDHYGWKGVDGKGMGMHSIINASVPGPVEAQWDGIHVNFGSGNCQFGPATTFDILGHEFMHGLIYHTSNLEDRFESGAIKESLCDMMGKTLEYIYDRDRFTWNIGEVNKVDPNIPPLRRMDDPKSLSMPAYYLGEFFSNADYQQVNSSIINLWFVLLSDGGSGINERGVSYDVPKIGIENAMRIAFNTNLYYTLSGESMQRFATNTLYASNDLFGEGSQESLAVQKAWNAVGVSLIDNPYKVDLQTSGCIEFVICQDKETSDVRFRVHNLGYETYLGSENAVVVLTGKDHPEYIIHLTEDILPGTYKQYVVKDWLQSHVQNAITLKLVITYADDNPGNNTTLLIGTHFKGSENDLVVKTWNHNWTHCNASYLNQYFLLEINSCVPLQAGTPIHCTIRNELGAVVHDSIFKLDSKFSLLTPIPYYCTIPVTVEHGGMLTYLFEVEGDSNQGNNSGQFGYTLKSSVTNNYLQTFNSFANEDPYMDVNYFKEDRIISLNGKQWLGHTNLSSEDDVEKKVSCLSPEQRIRDHNYKLIITTCVDFQAHESVTLEFDALTFISDWAELYNDPNSLIIQIKMQGTSNYDTLISNFTDNTQGHYVFDLPPYFTGKVEINGYALRGKGKITSEMISTYDVLLITNVEYIIHGLNNPPSKGVIHLTAFPNPTSSSLKLSSYEGILNQSYRIVDAYGKVQGGGIVSEEAIQMGHFPQGIYLIQMMNDYGHRVIVKTIRQ